MQETKSLNIFDIINDILYKKNGELDKDPSFEKEFVRIVIIRYISMIPELYEYSSYFNKTIFNNFSNKDFYHLLYNSIPQIKETQEGKNY